MQDLIDSYPVVVWIIGAIVAAIVFSVSAAIMSRLSGWWDLSKSFRLVGVFDGISDGAQSVRMRYGIRYGLRLGANESGLYLAVPFLFRLMHPPLFVPWNEIKMHKSHTTFGEHFALTLGRKLQIPLRLSRASVTMLQDGAGKHWLKGEA